MTRLTSFPGAAVHGAGLGLRRGFMDALSDEVPAPISFLEVAPENWLRFGGPKGRRFRALTERYPFVTHGLSLSLGGPDALDEDFVLELKEFLEAHDIRACTEHLSYCTDGGHLYDLMPIPFTAEAVMHVAARIRRVQDILERPIAVENVSYYAAPGAEMSELDFLRAVLDEADCGLLLDVNNVYVNSINHRYDPAQFIRSLPTHRIWYGHVAGHYVEAEDLRVDTHGTDVCREVWALLDAAYAHHGVFPTLVERDFNIPPLPQLLDEVRAVVNVQQRHVSSERRQAHG